MKIIGVIPARYKSSRFLGKPLADICGKPMICWVYNQARQVERLDEVYVATDDDRIVECCNGFNIPCLLTSEDHRNGTERIAEVSDKIMADIYVNIQGDEPLIEPHNIDKIIDMMIKNSEIQCATLKVACSNPVDVINGTITKVVSDIHGDVMLFTRSPVPYPKSSVDYTIFKSMGLFGYRRYALSTYRELKMGPVEKVEDIELLRFVENGFKVHIEETISSSVAVDTPKDLERVCAIIRERNHQDFT